MNLSRRGLLGALLAAPVVALVPDVIRPSLFDRARRTPAECLRDPREFMRLCYINREGGIVPADYSAHHEMLITALEDIPKDGVGWVTITLPQAPEGVTSRRIYRGFGR